MKILLASPERDLLECYKILLEADLGQTVTAFDGTQVLFLAGAEKFDIALLDSDLPRIEYGKLTVQLQRKGIPVIVLINDTSDSRKPSADAYLKYPFNYGQIKKIIVETLDRSKKG